MASHPADAQTARHQVTADQAHGAVRTLLIWIGEDPDRPGLVDTPGRVARALREMNDGYGVDYKTILAKRFPVSYDTMIVLRDCPFTSTCEHHLLPFTGKATVAYIPNPNHGEVVGLSKLARLVDAFARRLQIQEAMTQQIAYAIRDELDPIGVAVIVEAEHSCMACRGAKKPGAQMVTSAVLGAFRTNDAARAELLSIHHAGRST